MSRRQPHSRLVIDISDSDDEQAVTHPIPLQTCPSAAGNKQPNVPWQAPVALSGMKPAVPNPTKPAIHGGSVPPDLTPVPDASSNQRAAVARKPLMTSVDPVDLTLSSDEGETATVPPSPSTRSTNPAPHLQPRFIQLDTPSPPSAIAPLPTQKDPSQSTPIHKRVSSPVASPGLGVILVPGRKKRKRQIGGYQPGLLGFNDDHGDGTPNPVDTNPDPPTRKRARISIGAAKPPPGRLEKLLKKAAHDDTSKGTPNTGSKVSEKGNKVKGLRKKGRIKAGAPAKLKRSYLPPCEEPEKVDAVITPTDINNVLRTVTSDNEADEACMDIGVDMSGDPPPRGRSPTPVQHPQTPPLALGQLGTSNRPSQRTESTQEIFNVFDFNQNLVWDEEHDVGLQRALQLDCEMHSSPMRPTVCAPSVIELDDAVDFNSSPPRYPCDRAYGGVPGVGCSRECNDLAPYATEAVTFIGVYLDGPSMKTSDVGEAKGTSEEQVAEGTAGFSHPHEKDDIEEFIELDFEPIPSSSEGTLDEEDVVPKSPEMAQQTTPEERFITQATVTSPSGVTLSGSSRLSTSPGEFAMVDPDMKASDEDVGTNRRPSLFAAKLEPQEPILPQRSAPRGIHTSITGSKSAYREPAAPSKRTVPTSPTTRFQLSKKSTEPTIEDLERIVLKRLNLPAKALARRNPPVWEGLSPLRPKKLYLSAGELTRWELEQEPKPNGAEDDVS